MVVDFMIEYIERSQKIKQVLKIGIAHSCQKVNKIPFDKYDKKLDVIITENLSYNENFFRRYSG